MYRGCGVSLLCFLLEHATSAERLQPAPEHDHTVKSFRVHEQAVDVADHGGSGRE